MKRLRLSLRFKILLLALGLAWPPLVVISLLSLHTLNRAADSAIETSAQALHTQAEQNLEKRAIDKAALYNTTLQNIQQQMETVATYVRVLIDAGPAPENSTGRVWVTQSANPDRTDSYSATIARAQQLIPYLSTTVSNSSLINLAYVAFEDGGVTAFDHDIIEVISQLDSFDARQRPWYTAAREAGKTIWADTYIDANSGMPVVTCATPIYDSQGTFVGVAGFDVLLGTIQQDVLKMDLGTGGYAFLINGKGDIIARPDLNAVDKTWNEPLTNDNLLENTDGDLQQIAERMTQREQGIAYVRYEDSNVYLAYAPIESAGWSVGMVIPSDEIIKASQSVGQGVDTQQQQLRTQVVGLIILSLIAIPILGVLLTVLLVRPIRRLQIGAQRAANGDLEHQIPVMSDDEIGDLGRSFNQMIISLRQKMVELEENLHQFSTLNDVSNHFKAILSSAQLLQAIPRAVCQNFGFDRAVLYLVEGSQLRAVSASFGTHNEEQADNFLAIKNDPPLLLEGSSIEADIIRSRQAVIVDNPWENPKVNQEAQNITHSSSYVQVPIFGREEKVIGILSADYFHQQRAISARDAAELLTFAGMVGLSIENTRLYNDLERQVAQRTTELREALVRAQEADRLKGQFLASISHELRTPLNAIIGFSTVMMDEMDGPITPMQAEDLQTINQNGRFLLHMINELLDLAKIEAGRMVLNFSAVNMVQLIQDVADTVGGLLYGKQIILRLKIPPQLAPIRADDAKIRQVLLNLLSNAVKFTEEGEITIAARSVAMAKDIGSTNQSPANGQALSSLQLYLAISISDTGIGIASESLPLVFEEFHQVGEHKYSQRGSGLGLAITRRLVEAHNGRIWAESVPGQGSTFTFILPYEVPPAEDTSKDESHTTLTTTNKEL